MPAVAWLAFIAVQLATVLRFVAGVNGERPALLTLSALALLLGFVPWGARAMWIYLRQRADGKSG
jgi:uncharacterized protein involved in response to NO